MSPYLRVHKNICFQMTRNLLQDHYFSWLLFIPTSFRVLHAPKSQWKYFFVVYKGANQHFSVDQHLKLNCYFVFAYFSSFLQQNHAKMQEKHGKRIFLPAFGVQSTQLILKIYNICPYFKMNLGNCIFFTRGIKEYKG